MTQFVSVMTVMEGVILQEIVLWSLSGPPFLRMLCFVRGRKRHFNGSYSFRITQNCPSLVCMDCAKTYVSSLRGERELCDLHTGHSSDREL